MVRNKSLILGIFLSIFLIFTFIGAASYILTYNSGGQAVFFNNTQNTTSGIRLFLNSTGVFNGTYGIFNSFVFF